MKISLPEEILSSGCEKAFQGYPSAPAFPGSGALRLYVGDEFCERRLPSAADFGACVERASGRGVAVTLVTPYLSPRGVRDLEQLLDGFTFGREIELVINDWGALKTAERLVPRGLVPVLGRLLVSAYLTKAAAHSSFPEPFLDLLESHNIRRLEFNTQEHLVAARAQLGRRGFKAHLHWPYVYITTSRCCSAARGYVACLTDPAQPCAKECARSAAIMRRGLGAKPLYIKGNAYFIKEDKWRLPPFALPDRLVFDHLFPSQGADDRQAFPGGSCDEPF